MGEFCLVIDSAVKRDGDGAVAEKERGLAGMRGKRGGLRSPSARAGNRLTAEAVSTPVVTDGRIAGGILRFANPQHRRMRGRAHRSVVCAG